MRHSLRWRLLGAATLALAGCAAGPGLPSSADSPLAHVHLLSPRPAVIVPGAGNNLIYHGGPVMRQTSTSYAIFWLPPGAYMNPNYQALINRYFGDVGGSSLYNNDTQYYDHAGHIVNSSTFGGSWVDTSAYPAGAIQDAQIQAEVSKAMQTNGWTGGLTHEFFVYIGYGKNTCIQPGTCIAQGGFCAYHGFFQTGGTTVIYANMPYPSTFVGTQGDSCILQYHGGGRGPNNDPIADSAINVTSHEHMESVTDPLTTFQNGTGGWFDASGQEIGDKCAWTFGSINPDGGNITMNGDRYLVQQEWDNHISGCTLAGP